MCRSISALLLFLSPFLLRGLHARGGGLDGAEQTNAAEGKDADSKALDGTLADRKASLAIGPNAGSVLFWLKTGADPGRATLSFQHGDPRVLSFRAAGSKLTMASAATRKDSPKIETFELADQYIAVAGLWPRRNVERFVRPNLDRYPKDLQLEYVKNWGHLPRASEHFLGVEFHLDPAGFEIWLDGRYCGRFDGPRPVGLTVEPGQGGAVRGMACPKAARNEDYVPLDVSYLGSARLDNARLPCQEGLTEIHGVPLVVRGSTPGDVGAVRYVRARAEEQDIYLARSPLDGMSETFHFSVPANQYAYAHVLCTVDDGTDKVPELTARISRFVTLRGVSSDAIMDTHLKLPRPGEKVPPDIEHLGEFSYRRDGREVKSPLYLVRLALKTGAISDMIFQPHDGPLLGKEPYLDFEILGRTTERRYANGASYPDNSIKSSVKVLALTLERSPVELELKQEQPGNVFDNDERPAIAGELRGLRKTACTLQWTVRDQDDKTLGGGSQEFRLDQGAKQSFRIPLDKLDTGWYAVEVRAGEGNKALVAIPVTAAILGRDTRKAGVESPYAARTASVMQPPDAGTHGILMRKAGIRHITPMSASLDVGEKVYSQWKVYGYQIPWTTSNLQDDAAAEAEIKRSIRQYLDKYPSARSALIFHESGEGPFPSEMFDEPSPKPDPKTAERDERLFKLACRTCKVYRQEFPNIRLIVGNSGDSLNLLAGMMRMKFPREYIDAMGEESLGQAKMPENPHYEYGNGTALNVWHMKQLARKMGYGNIPVDACSEWKGRLSKDLGERTKAEWDMRDLLIAYACGFKIIRMPDITDQGSMFYDTEYGSQGALRRHPLLYPKPSYVAGATLTRVLDCVEFLRQVPMESDTTYVLEFRRYGREYVYAFWLPRGSADLSFDFGKETDLLHVGMLGRQAAMRTEGGKLVTKASTGPSYLVSPDKVKGVVRMREAPDAVPAGYFLANAMDRVPDWQLSPTNAKLNVRRSAANFYGVKGGDFVLAEANDPDRGTCLMLQLKVSDDDPAARSGSIKLKAPVEVPGKPNTVGAMVKGNSSWARLGFEFIDAEGETWTTCGGDWPANLSVNFDGWHFVRFPIDSTAQWPHHIYPNWIAGHWAPGGSSGNRRIDYPIKLVGISLMMPRKVLNLADMKDVKRLSVCFKDFGAYTDAESATARDSKTQFR